MKNIGQEPCYRVEESKNEIILDRIAPHDLPDESTLEATLEELNTKLIARWESVERSNAAAVNFFSIL